MRNKTFTRARCPKCGRELIFTVIIAGDVTFTAWICDCEDQPTGIKSDIVQAREWDNQCLIYELEYDPKSS